jgi:bacteriocin-like protein
MANFTELTDDQLELVTGGQGLSELAGNASSILGAITKSGVLPDKATPYVTAAQGLTTSAGKNAPTAPTGSLSDIFKGLGVSIPSV